MPVKGSSGFYEKKLNAIQESPYYGMPVELKQFQQAVDNAMQKLKETKSRWQDSDIFAGEACDVSIESCNDIERQVNSADIEGLLNLVQSRIDRYNEALDKVKSVDLPGDTLDMLSASRIRTASKSSPAQVRVPGLEGVHFVYGEEGVAQINTMLAEHREQVAKEIYDEVLGSFVPVSVDADLVPKVDRKEWSIEPDSQSLQYSGASLGTGLSAGGSGGASLPSSLSGSGVAGLPGSIPGADQLGNINLAGDIARPTAANTTSDRTMHGIGDLPRLQGSDTASALVGRNPADMAALASDGSQGNLSRLNYGSHDHAMSVDGLVSNTSSLPLHNLNGLPGSGASLQPAGTSALPSSSGMSHSLGTVGAVGSAGLIGGAAAGTSLAMGVGGVGTHFANTPVHATVTPSSFKGAQGLAAGLSSQAPAASQGTASRNGAMPAMMAGGQGAAANENKDRGRRLGYVAPKLEDDEVFLERPRAAMAGRRKPAQH